MHPKYVPQYKDDLLVFFYYINVYDDVIFLFHTSSVNFISFEREGSKVNKLVPQNTVHRWWNIVSLIYINLFCTVLCSVAHTFKPMTLIKW